MVGSDGSPPLCLFFACLFAFAGLVFRRARSFNSPLSSWDVGNVDTMELSTLCGCVCVRERDTTRTREKGRDKGLGLGDRED